MSGTYSQLLYHIVFSTKGREPWISEPIAPRVYSYIGGIVRGQGGALLDAGGVEDHVHLYIRWKPDGKLSELMRDVKAGSSLWIHGEFPALKSFAWQEGYSAFTVSKSQENAVRRYLAGQREHHRKEDFKSELLRILRAHEMWSSMRGTCLSERCRESVRIMNGSGSFAWVLAPKEPPCVATGEAAFRRGTRGTEAHS